MTYPLARADAEMAGRRSVERVGCALSYRAQGAGAPVLMIQGVGVQGDGWMPQIEALAPRFRCVSFDNRGMGASQPVGVEPTVEVMAADAWAVLEADGAESAHLVGHSLGGVIAQHMALTRPERVRSLSLLCTVARGRDATRLGGRMLWLGIASAVGTARSRRRAFLRIVMPTAALAGIDEDEMAAELGILFGHDLGRQPPIAMKQLRALRAYDSTASLARLASVPTLVVNAEHDLIAPPRHGRALAEGIPGARFVEIPDAAHGVPIQCAGEVNRLLAEHLEAAERRWEAAVP